MVERGLPHTDAIAIARQLRAIDAPQDEQRAQIIIANARVELANNTELSSSPSTPTSHAITREEAQSALAALANVARGGSQSVSDLAAFVAARRVPPRAYRKLDAESIALAGILARLHTAPQRERGAARPLLESLRDTLNAFLDEK